MFKKFSAFALSTIIVLEMGTTAFAQETPNANPEYLENHHQVNFDDLDIFVVNGTSIDISAKNNLLSYK